MIGINNLDCCGIEELVDIADYETEPKTIIVDICTNYFENENQCAFYMFSDIQRKRSGKNLCKFIKKHKLGLITQSPSRVNPNSGNSLTIWIWTINKRNLRSFYSKNCKD
ncbi:MAG: hypothetical protein WC917_00010 [Bacilli bacterium]|jgi:hypothetical protein